MNYDELIKDLREQAEHYCKHCSEKSGEHMCGYKGDQYCGPKTLLDAADAIEELQGELWKAISDNTDLLVMLPRWISVGDRLPESGQACLCYYVGGAYKQLSWISLDTFYECDSLSGFYPHLKDAIDGEVTHWMPLPEPPKEEQT